VPFGFVEQRAHLEAAGFAVEQEFADCTDGVTRIDDVIDQDHVPAANVGLMVRIDAYETARFRFIVRGNGHEIHRERAMDLAHQVGNEHHTAAQQSQQQQLFRIFVICRDLLPQSLHPPLDLFLRKNDAVNEIIGEMSLIFHVVFNLPELIWK